MTGKSHDFRAPEHLSKPGKTKDEKVDQQMADTFPASDPPSYSGGNHIIGAPRNRESESPGPRSPEVLEAQKKAGRPH
jgi:hypothetical protein